MGRPPRLWPTDKEVARFARDRAREGHPTAGRHLSLEERTARRRALLEVIRDTFGLNKDFGVGDCLYSDEKLRAAIELIGSGRPSTSKTFPLLTPRVLRQVCGQLIDGLLLVEVAEKRWRVVKQTSSAAAPVVVSRRVDRDGRVTLEHLMGRDGNVVTDKPTPAAPAPAPQPAETIDGDPRPWIHGRRQATKAELAAAHERSQAIGRHNARDPFVVACEIRNARIYE